MARLSLLPIEEHTVLQNVGGMDRIGRIGLGLGLVAVGAAGYTGIIRVAIGPLPQAFTAVLAVIVGAILLDTVATRACLIDALPGLSTTRSPPHEESIARESTPRN